MVQPDNLCTEGRMHLMAQLWVFTTTVIHWGWTLSIQTCDICKDVNRCTWLVV